jgi:signal transduction histidine kinase
MGKSGLIIFFIASLLIFITFLSGLLIFVFQFRKKEILHKQEKQLIALNSLLEGQELERSRMAKDLHDGVGGILSSIKLNLTSMKGNQIIDENDVHIFNRSLIQLDNAIKEMRRIAHNMMPEALLKFGINEAVKDFCDDLNSNKVIKVKFIPVNNFQIPLKTTEVMIFRIIQELVNNSLKHANPKNILIQFSENNNRLFLIVEDDGIGFDTTTLASKKGTGIKNIQSRVEILKGSILIESETARGTTATIEIPI